MGEIADLMFDGTLCGSCGVQLPGEGYGVPRYCKDCRKPGGHETQSREETRRRRRKKKK
jgi:predicted amidophosphoribosyltransferase